MPHSTASEPVLSGGLVEEDSIILDAPGQVPDYTKEEGKIDMYDSVSPSEDSAGEAPRMDVKLEDIFNDVDDDEDDEFSGSRVSNTNSEGSPQEAPL